MRLTGLRPSQETDKVGLDISQPLTCTLSWGGILTIEINWGIKVIFGHWTQCDDFNAEFLLQYTNTQMVKKLEFPDIELEEHPSEQVPFCIDCLCL